MSGKGQRSITVHDSIWNVARDKAGHIPLSQIIRVLLVKWLNGELEITMEDLRK